MVSYKKLGLVNTKKMFAKAIKRIHGNESVNDLFNHE